MLLIYDVKRTTKIDGMGPFKTLILILILVISSLLLTRVAGPGCP